MASRDDNRFTVKPGAPKGGSDAGGAGNGQRAQRFVSQVLKQVSKAGATASGARGARPASTFGRGRVAAGMAGRGIKANARRVVIKSRFVVLKKVGANSVSTHLRYIERDGVTREGARGQAYGSETDSADLKAFEERGKGDRHQFRFIVSVEDAEQLEDLRSYTRVFMQRMSIDLQTPLDWVAVDHWDTDSPHTHIVVRGRVGNGSQGQDLVIAPDYMAHGMRMRASELATEWLGPRTELEIRQSLLREVEQERLTSLDRALLRQAVLDVVDLTDTPGNRQHQTVLRSRLQVLEGMALAECMDGNHWRLGEGMQATLTALGERGDILRTMHKALKGQQRECMIEADTSAAVVGRIAAKGLADELNDRGYLVVDGIDGRAHYLKLPAGANLSELPMGGIVHAKAPGHERPIDKDISNLAQGGIYRATDHLERLLQDAAQGPQSTVDVTVRRLETLRRAGIADRVTDGVWKVPSDFLARAKAFDIQKAAGLTVELRSHLPLDQQVQSIGATWLDRQLVGGDDGLARQGFGTQVRAAMSERVDFLSELGLAERQGRRVTFARNLLGTLRDRELAGAGKAIQDQTGLKYRPLNDGESSSGIYRRSVQLASGRFAMLDDGMGFSLVPWRPVVEQRLGQQVSATYKGGTVSLQWGRQRGMSL
jgi:type IV secretory pathway VirD2 relaxase